MRVVHELVSHDGSGVVFEIEKDDVSFIDGFISPSDRKLKVSAWSQSKLVLAEVMECAEAWKLAVETVRLHEQCFVWKLEFSAMVESGEVALLWHIWAPTAEVAHERLLGHLAGFQPKSPREKAVCEAAMKGTWVRA